MKASSTHSRSAVSRIPISHTPYPSRNPFSGRTSSVYSRNHNLFYFDEATDPGTPPPPPSQSVIDEAIKKRVDELLGSKSANNDPMAALSISLKAQHRLEGEVERQKAELERLKSSQPKEAELKDLKSLQQLLTSHGLKDLSELSTALDTGKKAQQDNAAFARKEVLASAAETLKLKNNPLLHSLLKDVELVVEGDGDARKVSVKNEEKAVDWGDFLKTRPDLEAAMPALQQGTDGGSNGSGHWVKQGNSSDGKPGTVYDKVRADVKAKQEAEKTTTGPQVIGERLGMK